MTNPFKARKPWVAFPIALILGPFLGMLYLGRARWAGLYLLLYLGLLAGLFVVWRNWLPDMRLEDCAGYFTWPYALIGASHAAWLAWKHPHLPPLPWYARWYIVAGAPVAFLALLLVNRAFLFPFYYIPSEGMAPTFSVNDCLFGSRLTYAIDQPQRGDVIVFHPHGHSIVYVKRIIGLPHDRVQMRHGVVFINGTPAARSAIVHQRAAESLPGMQHGYTILKQQNDGPFDDTDVVTVPAGYYFVLGDNRDNSMDSRMSDIGLVSRRDVIGKVVLKFFDGPSRRVVIQSVP